jgi:4a-hydroxytetrahydrobiopterin dehydratase
MNASVLIVSSLFKNVFSLSICYCKKDVMPILNTNEIHDKLSSLPGWEVKDGQLAKTFIAQDFQSAIAFVVRVAFFAEAADHHPDIAIAYNKVGIALSTHSEGGITEKDFALAEKIERVFRD